MNSATPEMRELPELKKKPVTRSRSKEKLVPHCDLIPEELLTTLISTASPVERSPVAPKITKTPPDFKVRWMRGANAVWQYPIGRRKYRHLLDQPTSATGAGRDVSFLCDAMVSQGATRPLTEMADLSLEQSLIPSEFHIVRNKGVVGLKCYEDKYTVLLEDEEKRLRVFPSMKPSSRMEVLQLKKVMDMLLEKAGVNQDLTQLKSFSQMESLLHLVRVEQDIYNTVFHELIRQVGVQCAERGQLLAELRQRYVALLDGVPQRLKGLHTEALAQRALGRRHVEEITHLRRTVAQLNDELREVKGRHECVCQQAESAKQDLATTQEDLQRTSDLVAEHRELYEMQRHRLEGQVTKLTNERDLWGKVTYRLALKVIEANKLQQASKLDASCQTWAKTAKHFTTLLTTKDTEDMRQIMKLTDQWKDEVTIFTQRLSDTEQSQWEEMKKVLAGITQWQGFCEAHIKSPDMKLDESLEKLFIDLKQWSLTLTAQLDHYGGEDLLSCQETLSLLSRLQDDWVDVGLQLFRRHPGPEGEPPKGQETMRELGRAVSELHKQLEVRITGESGVYKLLISLIGSMERWALKLKAAKDRSEALPRSDWLNLEKDLGDWTKLIGEALIQVSSTWTESETIENVMRFRIEKKNTFAMLREFASAQDVFFDCENQRLSDEANSIHSALIHWMVDLLLFMVPDVSDGQEPPQNPGPDPQTLVVVSLQELEEDAKHLSQKLDHFSKYSTSSCLPIVEDDLQKKLPGNEPGNELAELNKLQRQSKIWREACRSLLLDIKGVPADAQETAAYNSIMDIHPSVKAGENSMDEDMETLSNTGVEEEEEEEEEAVREEEEEGSQPVGKVTEGSCSRKSIGHDSRFTEKTLTSEAVTQSQAPGNQKTFDAVATVAALQLKLLGAEDRAQSAEDHARRTDDALQIALEKVLELEEQLKARASAEQREKKKTARTTSKRDVTAEPRTVSPRPDSNPKQRSAPKKH